MKFCNIIVDNHIHLGVSINGSVFDLNDYGCKYTIEDIISGADVSFIDNQEVLDTLSPVESPVFSNVVNKPVKILCVGLNYQSHVDGINMGHFSVPVLFSKFFNCLCPTDSNITLPAWEESYDYEAELVIVIGKKAWNVSENEAENYIFGYTCGNDFSCRDPQKRTSQWLIGKAMPGFAPCGPYITPANQINPEQGISIKSYVNGQLRQDGKTSDMIFNCRQIVSYASKYIALEPGDLIFTGTPSGVALEKEGSERQWLKAGDTVDIEIEGIGRLTNHLV